MNQFRSIENVINKVIRVLSNLAISEENGFIIIRRDDCIDLLFKLLSKIIIYLLKIYLSFLVIYHYIFRITKKT